MFTSVSIGTVCNITVPFQYFPQLPPGSQELPVKADEMSDSASYQSENESLQNDSCQSANGGKFSKFIATVSFRKNAGQKKQEKKVRKFTATLVLIMFCGRFGTSRYLDLRPGLEYFFQCNSVILPPGVSRASDFRDPVQNRLLDEIFPHFPPIFSVKFPEQRLVIIAHVNISSFIYPPRLACAICGQTYLCNFIF